MRRTCQVDDCFRAKEAFGQHLLRKTNTPQRPSPSLRCQLRASFGTPAGRPLLGRSSLGIDAANTALEAAQQREHQQQQAVERLEWALMLERSRRQALERKVEGLPQAEAGTPRTGQEKQWQQEQRREDMLQQRREVEAVKGGALRARVAAEARLYSCALREAEAEAARTKAKAFHLGVQHAAVEQLLRDEVRRCEVECSATRQSRTFSAGSPPAAAVGGEEGEGEEAVVVIATPYAQRKREHTVTNQNVKTGKALVPPPVNTMVSEHEWNDVRGVLTPGAFAFADADADTQLSPPPAAASAAAAATSGSVCITRRGRNAQRSALPPAPNKLACTAAAAAAAAASQEAQQLQQAASPSTPTPPTPAPPPPAGPPPTTPASSGSDDLDAAPPPPAGPPPPTPPPPAGLPQLTPEEMTRSKLPRASRATADENRNPQRKKRAAVEPEPVPVAGYAGGRRNR